MSDRSLQFNVYGRATTSGFAKAAAEVDFLAGRLKGLSDKHVKVKVDYDKNSFKKFTQEGWTKIESGFMAVQEKGVAAFQSIGASAGHFFTAQAPQIILMTILFMHFAAIAVVVSGLLAGIAAGLVAIAAISMAGLAIGFLGVLGPAMKLFKAVQGGNKEIAKLPKTLQPAAKAVKGLVDTFKSWGNQFEKPVGKIVETLAGLGKKLLPTFTPIVNGMLGAVDKMAAGFSKMLTGPIWGQFFKMLETSGPKIFGDMSQAAGKFLTGFMSMITQTAPFAETLSAKINKVADSFLRWTQSAKGQKDIKEFFDWVKKTGPGVWDKVKEIGDKVWDFVKKLGQKDIKRDLQNIADGIMVVAHAIKFLMDAIDKSKDAIGWVIKNIAKLPGVGGNEVKGNLNQWEATVGKNLDGVAEKARMTGIGWTAGLDLASRGTGHLRDEAQKAAAEAAKMAASVTKAAYDTGYGFSIGLQTGASAGKAYMALVAQGAISSTQGMVAPVTQAAYQTGWGFSVGLQTGTSAGKAYMALVAQGAIAAARGMVGPVSKAAYDTGWGFSTGIKSGADAAKNSMAAARASINASMDGVSGGAFNKGYTIGAQLAAGITASQRLVRDAMYQTTKQIGEYIPASPVKKGPLKILNNGYSGGKIARMLADGITKGSGYATSAAAGMSSGVAGQLSVGAGASGGSTGGPSVVVNATVQSPVDVDILASRIGFGVRSEAWG